MKVCQNKTTAIKNKDQGSYAKGGTILVQAYNFYNSNRECLYFIIKDCNRALFVYIYVHIIKCVLIYTTYLMGGAENCNLGERGEVTVSFAIDEDAG